MENSQELNLSKDWVWLVLRRDPKGDPTHWHIQGIGADENLAIGMCKDENYMIGPIPMNASLPEKRIDWVGSYFPLKDK